MLQGLITDWLSHSLSFETEMMDFWVLRSFSAFSGAWYHSSMIHSSWDNNYKKLQWFETCKKIKKYTIKGLASVSGARCQTATLKYSHAYLHSAQRSFRLRYSLRSGRRCCAPGVRRSTRGREPRRQWVAAWGSTAWSARSGRWGGGRFWGKSQIEKESTLDHYFFFTFGNL